MCKQWCGCKEKCAGRLADAMHVRGCMCRAVGGVVPGLGLKCGRMSKFTCWAEKAVFLHLLRTNNSCRGACARTFQLKPRVNGLTSVLVDPNARPLQQPVRCAPFIKERVFTQAHS